MIDGRLAQGWGDRAVSCAARPVTRQIGGNACFVAL
jgi:hypothetical protein